MIAFVPGHTFGKTGDRQRRSSDFHAAGHFRQPAWYYGNHFTHRQHFRQHQKTADRQSYSPGPTKRRQCVVGYAAKAIALP
ncbi:Uncharacterised protein [Klebsiella pneumoniae]|nr:Uncharacterised protein [Klebsiella pneumoniae]